MPATVRLLIGGGALILAGYALAMTQPGSIPQVATDVFNLATYRAELHEEAELRHQLDEKSEALMTSELIKLDILQDLIHERLALIDAAKRYRELDRVRLHGQQNKYCLAWPGSTEIERYCRQIIHAVECDLHEQPSVAGTVLARLNREFQAAADSGSFCLLRWRSPRFGEGTAD